MNYCKRAALLFPQSRISREWRRSSKQSSLHQSLTNSGDYIPEKHLCWKDQGLTTKWGLREKKHLLLSHRNLIKFPYLDVKSSQNYGHIKYKMSQQFRKCPQNYKLCLCNCTFSTNTDKARILNLSLTVLYTSRCRYKPEGNACDSRWVQCNFSFTQSFLSHYRNAYQGVKAAGT